MFYLTYGLGSTTIEDDVVILNGDSNYFGDNGLISAGGVGITHGLELVGNSRTLTLCGTRTGFTISTESHSSQAAVAGGVYFSGNNATINFAAQGGSEFTPGPGIRSDSDIRIGSYQDYYTSSNYPTATKSGVAAILADESLTFAGNLSGHLDGYMSAVNDGYYSDGSYVDASTGGNAQAYGVSVGKDLTIASNFTGLITVETYSLNRGAVALSANDSKAVAIGLKVTDGALFIAGLFDGSISAITSITALGRLSDYIQNKEAMPGDTVSADSFGVSALGIEAQSISIGSVWSGSISAAYLKPVVDKSIIERYDIVDGVPVPVYAPIATEAIRLGLVKLGASDSKNPLNPPLNDVKGSADNGTVAIYAVKSGTVDVGRGVDGNFFADGRALNVDITLQGKNATGSASGWKIDIAALSATSMNVAEDLGGVFTAYGETTFKIVAGANTPAGSTDKVGASATLSNNKVTVAGIKVDNLTVAGKISSTIDVSGTYLFTVSTSGSTKVAGGIIENNSVVVAGILGKTIKAAAGISANITVHGAMGVRGSGTFNWVKSSYNNSLGIYGIKADSLLCSNFSGTITVTSEDLSTTVQSNTNLQMQTVGIYVAQAINGGAEDVAMTISGNINVHAEAGVAVGILRGVSSAGGIGSVNIAVSGSINVSSSFGPAYAIFVGDIWSKVAGDQGRGNSIELITIPIDDQVTISAGATVIGDIDLATGSNYVTIDSRAAVTGRVLATGGTLNLTFNLVGVANSTPILSTSTDFGTAECSVTTFTLDVNQAESGIYNLLYDSNGISSKWIGREISILYNGQTTVFRIGLEGSGEVIRINGTENLSMKVYVKDGTSIVAELTDASPAVSVGPGVADPTVVVNSATFMWQDMSVAFDPADPVDPDSPIANVAWAGKQVSHYEVEISVSSDFGRAQAYYIYGDSDGFAPTGLHVEGLSGGTYYWRVRAFYSDGTLSSWSTDSMADITGDSSANFTVVDQVIYSTPESIDVTSMTARDPNGAEGRYSNSTVLLDWADSSAETGIGYYVVEYFTSTEKVDYYLSADQDGWDSWVANGGSIQTRVISASELFLTGLGNFTNLHWRVKAVANDLGGNIENVPIESEWSYYQDPVLVWAGDKTAPTAPSKLDVNAVVNTEDSSKIDMELLWSVSNDAQSGVQRYIIQYGLAEDWSDAVEVVVSGSAAQLSPDGKVTIPGLGETLNNQCYYWRVQAVDYVGNVSEWTEGKTFIIDMTSPTDPVAIGVNVTGTTENGADGIEFTWTPSIDASTLSYTIQISVTGDFDSDFYEAAANVAGVAVGQTMTYTISEDAFLQLLAGSGYSFADGSAFHWRIKAFDHPVGASYSNESNWVSGEFTVDLFDDTPPEGPETITVAQVAGQRSFSVTWTPATDNKPAAVSYEIAYKVSGELDWTNKTSNSASFTLTGVAEGSEYTFRVRAIDAAGNLGDWSDEASIICDATAPTNNFGLSSTVTSGPNGSVVFSWNVATDEGDAARGLNTNYILQYSTNYLFTPGATLHSITVDSTNMVIANGRVTLTITGSDLSAFSDLTTYFWRVQAVDNAGNKSGFSSGSDKFTAPDVTPPTDPANLAMTRVANQQMTRFEWAASTDNSRSVSYILSYWTAPDKSDIQSVTVSGTSKELALPAGEIHWSVQAVDGSGNKSSATEASGTVDYIAPYIPSTRVSAVDQATREVTLSWTPANPDDPAPGSGLEKYEIRYSNTSAYNPADTITVTVDGSLSQYVIASNGLKDGETYYWQIRAIDHNGNASVWNDGAGSIFIAPDTTNVAGDAKSITLGQSVNERVGGTKDPADYFMLALSETGNYTFSITSTASTVGITLVNMANNLVVTYRAGQAIDLMAGNYRIAITNTGASVEYTFNSTVNSVYNVNNNDDTWNNPANTSEIVLVKDNSDRSGETTDWVGFGDITDYYKLVIDKAGQYSLTIDGLDNNAVMTLYLVNAAGTGITTQVGWSTTAQVYRSVSGVTITNNKLTDKLLAAGTYYVKIDRTGATSTNYHIDVEGTAFPTNNTDDTVALVNELVANDPTDVHNLTVAGDGSISGYGDWVGFGDLTDLYTFTLTEKGTYSFELSNLSSRASFTLLQKTATGTLSKASFSVTPTTTVTGSKTALINLDEGTYYIQVTAIDGNSGKNTDYSVSVTGQATRTGEDDNNANTAYVAGNPLSGTAGVLAGSFSDWVGYGDTSDFRLVGTAQGAVSMTVMIDEDNPATVYIYRVAENSAGPGTLIGTVTPILTYAADGSVASLRNNILTVNTGSATDNTTYKYYVEVRSTGAASGKNTDYTVTTSGGRNDVNATDNVMGSAQIVSIDADGVAAAIHDGGIGFGDTQDYYKLVLTRNGGYSFDIDGLTGSASTVTLRLLNASGIQLKTITVNVAAGETLGHIDLQALQAGTYYLNVTAPNAGFTAYDITINGAYSAAGGNSRETAHELDFSVVPPAGGSAMRAARPVDESTVVNLGGSAEGWVGVGDTVDFYRFTVDGDGTYNFSFRGIDNAAVLTIYTKSYNSLGQEIASMALGQIKCNGNFANLSLLLTSGDYYLEVSSASEVNPTNTNYYIDATATTFATLQVNGLNSIDFDAAGATIYRFDLAMDGDLSLSIDGDAKTVRYSLYYKVGGELVEIKSSDRLGDLNVKNLAAGTYFVKVNYAGSGSANFALDIDLPDQMPPAAGSSSLDMAIDDDQSAGLWSAGIDNTELSFGLDSDPLAAGSALSLDSEKEEALKMGLLA